MKNNNASCRGLEVFDFTEEDELPELISGKRLTKFNNPNSETDAVLKYEFLQFVARGSNNEGKEVGNQPCVDVDFDECHRSCDDGVSHILLGADEEQLITEEESYQSEADTQMESSSHERDTFVKVDNCAIGNIDSEIGRIRSSSTKTTLGLNCTLSEFAVESEQNDVFSDANGSFNGSSPTSPPSELAEDSVLLNGKSSNTCSSDTEMDDLNEDVVLCPDYIVYEDNYCAGPLLTFSNNGIKINGFTNYGSDRIINVEWGMDDLIDIKCQWLQRVEIVMIKLRVISKDAVQCDDGCDTSGIKEVKIAVVDSYWSEKQERITLLNSKYMAIWNTSLNVDMATDRGDDLLGQRRYFPNFDKPFEEVVYPKGDPDAVSISKRDVDLLQPETFVNDTIIDFYIQYLKSQIEPEEKHRFHFFNSFFFRKLADLDKDPSSASDGRAAFLRVRKWTRKVDLFDKDYIFIPINFNLHWSLMVICHPGEVAKYSDEGSMKVPCILHMDSIKGSHSGLKNLIQSYLLEEWKERHNEMSEDVSSKFNNLRFLPLELPQQENSFDCGLFLLHYLELFLTEAPLDFSPFKISRFSKFLNVDWFPPAEAYLKRTLIQRLIFEILENRSREISKAACRDELLSEFPENIENETGVVFLPERGGSDIACHQNLSDSQAVDGIEITLLSESSSRSNQFVNNSGLVVRQLLEPGASNGSILGHYQSFDHSSSYYDANATELEEDAEADTEDHFMYLPPDHDGLHPIEGMTPQACSFPCSSKGFESEATFDLGISMQPEHGGIASCSETSSPASDNLEDVGILESCNDGETTPCKKEEMQPEHGCIVSCPVTSRPTSDNLEDVGILESCNDGETTPCKKEEMQPEHDCIASSLVTSSPASDNLEDVGILESCNDGETTPCKKEEMQPEHDCIASSLVTSSPASDNLEDFGILESCDDGETTPCKKERMNRKRSLPVEDLEGVVGGFISATNTMQDAADDDVNSQDTNIICEEMKNGDCHPMCNENHIASPHLDEDIATKTDFEHGVMPVVAAFTEVELNEQQAAKKPRLSPLIEEESNDITTENLSNDTNV